MNAAGTRTLPLSHLTPASKLQQARGAEAARFKAALGTSQAQGEQLRTQLELATSALEAAERKLGAADERCAALAGQGTWCGFVDWGGGGAACMCNIYCMARTDRIHTTHDGRWQWRRRRRS